MKDRCVVALAVILPLLVAGADVAAASDSASVKSNLAESYSFGFDSFSVYTAPGTNRNVDVGGVFTLEIGSKGSVTQSDATL
jgi:hypothetical protein